MSQDKAFTNFQTSPPAYPTQRQEEQQAGPYVMPVQPNYAQPSYPQPGYAQQAYPQNQGYSQQAAAFYPAGNQVIEANLRAKYAPCMALSLGIPLILICTAGTIYTAIFFFVWLYHLTVLGYVTVIIKLLLYSMGFSAAGTMITLNKWRLYGAYQRALVINIITLVIAVAHFVWSLFIDGSLFFIFNFIFTIGIICLTLFFVIYVAVIARGNQSALPFTQQQQQVVANVYYSNPNHNQQQQSGGNHF